MTNNRTTPDREVVEVEQIDRDNAADYDRMIGRVTARDADNIRSGEWDATSDVQWFAKRRIATSSAGVPADERYSDAWNDFFEENLTDGNDGYLKAEIISLCRKAFDAAPKPEPAPPGVEELRAALEEIAKAYDEWSPDSLFASTALFKVSARARAALADRGAR